MWFWCDDPDISIDSSGPAGGDTTWCFTNRHVSIVTLALRLPRSTDGDAGLYLQITLILQTLDRIKVRSIMISSDICRYYKRNNGGWYRWEAFILGEL